MKEEQKLFPYFIHFKTKKKVNGFPFKKLIFLFSFQFLGVAVWTYTDKYLGSLTCTPTITHPLGDKKKNYIIFTSRGRANPNGKMRSGVPEFLAAGVWCLGPQS